jgi:hypothetical protein
MEIQTLFIGTRQTFGEVNAVLSHSETRLNSSLIRLELVQSQNGHRRLANLRESDVGRKRGTLLRSLDEGFLSVHDDLANLAVLSQELWRRKSLFVGHAFGEADQIHQVFLDDPRVLREGDESAVG